ncbi:lactonase family protein [Streptacidiphilus sp. N1-3]|uniref:Lactonase family protein n=1 Tax=Streptacidiphilus alkalitolerans TaxID=3342712 RepID=A0ABV6XD99_9ACTN
MAIDDLDRPAPPATAASARPVGARVVRRRSVLAVGAGLTALPLVAAFSGPADAATTRGAAPAAEPGAATEAVAEALAAGGAVNTTKATTQHPLYIGGYTTSSAQGVGLATYDPTTGRPTATGTLAGVANPSFLALSGSHLYAVDEQTKGAVTAISVVSPGHLTSLGSQSTGGSGPCHVSVHPAGRHLLSANYDSGSIAVHPIAADGSLKARSDLVKHTGSGPDPDRQDGPHAHMVISDPQGAYVLAVDLGTDSVYSYTLNTTTGKLTPVSQAKVAPGTGPRHLAFHPSGQYAYLANELGNSVIVCRYNPSTGALTPGRPQPTVPSGAPTTPRNYPAEVVVSPDGAFVYVSNRGHDSVARFAVGSAGATLTLLDAVPAGGAYPRHISLDPTATLLFSANQNSNTVTVFRRNTTTGALTATGTSLTSTSPVCVLPVQ